MRRGYQSADEIGIQEVGIGCTARRWRNRPRIIARR
jgi:hypothetical protein